MDVFNLQAKIGLDVDEYLNGIKTAVNSSKKLVDAVNQMATQAGTMQTQSDKTGKSLQGTAADADALGKSVSGSVSPIDKLTDAVSEAANNARKAADQMDGFSDTVEDVGDEATEAAENIDNLTDAIDQSGKESKKTTDNNKNLGKETKSAGDRASEAGNKFKDFGEKLKSAAENVKRLVTEVAKISTAIVGAATTGITALTKQSLDAYGTYEQLLGGIEAAFEGNQKAINIVTETGKNAWKTLTMSTNEYYEAFMAAYPLVKSGMADQNAAIETTNKLMQLEADLANTFGYTAENAANAINWALKGTYSYLDNLNIGIKGTKEGFLEAANASGIFNKKFESVDDMTTDQQIDVIMHYAKAYGVLDRTAKEAAGTLEGSSKALRAAWQNLLTGFGREDANLSELSSNLIDSISAVASNIAPRIGKILDGIGAALPVLIPKMYEQAKKLIADNASSFVSSVGSLLSSGGEVVRNILNDVISALPEQLPAALDTAGRFITDGLSRATTSLSKIGEIGGNIVSIILDGLENNLPEILDGANAFFGNFLRQLPKMIDGQSIGNLVTILIDGFVGGIDAVLDNAEMLIDAGAKLITGIGNGLAAGIPGIIERAPEIIQALADGITNNIDDVILTAETLISALVNALMDPETLEKLVAAAINLAGAILQGLGDGLVAVYDIFNESIGIGFFQDHALEIGKAIMQGIHDGFYSIDELTGIIDFIGGTLGEAYLTIEACVNEITSYVTAAWNGFETIGGEIYDFIEGIKSGFVAALAFIIENAAQFVNDAFEFIANIKNGITDFFENLATSGSEFISNVKSAWDEFWAGISQSLTEKIAWFSEKLQKIPDKFSELVDSARTWGTDMIQNFIDGITAKWRALQEKVTSVAQLVADYLHFSVPEKGPLADFDKSAPDMMELFAKGIKDNERLIADQFDNSLALLDSPEIGARMAVTGTAGIDGTNSTGEAQNAVQSNLSALMAILAEILAAVKEGRIVAIDDAGYRTINEGLGRIRRIEERGMLI
jgi:phage-related protein